MGFLPSQNLDLNLSVRTRLIVGFVTVMLLFVGMAVTALWTLASYQKDLSSTRSLDSAAFDARNMRGSLSTEALAFTDLLIRQDAKLENTYREQNDKLVKEQLPALLNAQLIPTEQELLAKVNNEHQKLSELYDAAISQIKARYYYEADRLWVNEIQLKIAEIVNTTNLFTNSLEERAKNQDKQANSTLDWSRLVIITALLITLLLSILIALTTIKAIVIQNKRLETTLAILQQAKQEIEKRQMAGQQFSGQVLLLAAQLNATSSQQASSSQQQVTLITEMGSSLEELSGAADQIAGLADRVSTAANLVAENNHQIEETTTLSVSQSEKGLRAVEQTIEVSIKVAELYQQLLHRLKELVDKNSSMHFILGSLKALSDETHLLSLNAAIEATGAGQYGERFRVVAHEVKSLANRSAEASKQVVNIVKEIQRASLEAIEAAQSGYGKAMEMEQVANQTGAVISEMRKIAEHSQVQASSINLTAKEVKELTEVIKGATFQQRSATEQVVQTLQELTIVAQQSASGSTLVSAAAEDLEGVSQDLNLTLVV
jgi:methyl-accepting chemotaxis protein